MGRETSELQRLIAPVAEGLGFELVGHEYMAQGTHSLLRVYIDHPEGITVDDCADVSRQLSAVFDVEDPIRGHYTLEVSSPGLDRPLFGAKDFERFVGCWATVKMLMPLDGRRKFSGKLQGVEEQMVIIECEGERFQLPLSSVDKARLIPDL